MTRRGVSVTMERREKALLGVVSTNDRKKMTKQSRIRSSEPDVASTLCSDSDETSPGAYAVQIVRSSPSSTTQPITIQESSQQLSNMDVSLRSWDPTEAEADVEAEGDSELENQSRNNRIPRQTSTAATMTAKVAATTIAITEPLSKKETKRICQPWHIILVTCLLIAAIGGVIAAILVTKNNGTNKRTGVGNQSKSTEPNSTTTTTRQECNFTNKSNNNSNNNNINPSPVLQCSCASEIVVASESTTSLYMDMKASQLLSRYDGPNFDCRHENIALWWTAMDPRAAISFTSISNASVTNLQVLQQRYGLALLYISLQGWNAPIASSLWLGEDQECNWQGITCDLSSRITGINLTSLELSGELPGSSFTLLPALTSLIMADNSLSGTIPLELWTLSQLKILDLSSNRFEGTIPDTIIYLSELTLLSLGQNNFNFILPENLYRLTKLEHLNLRKNDFTGSISLNIGILSKLQSLSIGENRFGSRLPTTLGYLTALSTLSIRINGFTGAFPTELGLLSNHLITISAFSNFFTGTIPTTLGLLTELITFDMENNIFTGSLPSEYGNWTKLQALILNTNDLVGMLPSLDVSHLTSLQLEGNSFSGTAPNEFCTIVNVSLPCTVQCDCCSARCIP